VALFERLRQKRYELAQARGIPPYVIFHDSTLAAMALHRPANREDLLQLSGVGETKLQRYGETFLAVIRDSSLHNADIVHEDDSSGGNDDR
jgi:ATP-dependent DNA helicase RecQ